MLNSELLEVLSAKITNLNLSVRLSNCLRLAEIFYIGELVNKNREDLLMIKNFGRKTLLEVEDLLSAMNLELGMAVPFSSSEYKLFWQNKKKLISSEISNPRTDHKIFCRLFIKVEDLDLSVRSLNCMNDLNIVYLGQLVQRNIMDLFRIKNMGRKSIKEISNKLSLLDLSFGMTIPEWSANEISEYIKIFSKDIEAERLILINKIDPKYLEGIVTIEDEMKYLASAAKSARDKQMVMKYYGWDGDVPLTLREVADKFNMTHERVRQICSKVEEKWKKRKPSLCILNKILEFINDNLPARASEIESSIVGHGFANQIVRIAGLKRVASMAGQTVPFQITTIGNDKIVYQKNTARALKLIIHHTKKSISRWGVTTIEDIIFQTNKESRQSIDSKSVTFILTLLGDFSWLDKESGWFWLTSTPRNTLITQIRKILSVNDQIDISDLRAGISRFHRMGGFSPPRRVLLELCKQLCWCKINGNMISACPALNASEVLEKNSTESIFFSILKNHGSVMLREDLEQACIQKGMNRATFYMYLGYSPIISKYAPGVYGLRGSQVLLSDIESIKPQRKFKKMLADYGWTSDGKIWIVFHLSASAITSGVLTIPSVMTKYLNSHYVLKVADNSLIGPLTVKKYSCWNLRPLFKRRGGEPDDYLVLVFDNTSKEAIAHIGDADLLYHFQSAAGELELFSNYSELKMDDLQ